MAVFVKGSPEKLLTFVDPASVPEDYSQAMQVGWLVGWLACLRTTARQVRGWTGLGDGWWLDCWIGWLVGSGWLLQPGHAGAGVGWCVARWWLVVGLLDMWVGWLRLVATARPCRCRGGLMCC